MSISHLPAGRQRGLTIVELIMFIVIVSIALAGVLQVLNLTTRTAAEPVTRKQALAIAEGLLEEVELAHFTFCDPTDSKVELARNAADCATKEAVGNEAGSQGRPFDNVNDYVSNYNVAQPNFNNGSGELTDALGEKMPVSGYIATVAVSPVSLSNTSWNIANTNAAADEINALLITITVWYNNAKDSVVLEGYRTRYAPQTVP